MRVILVALAFALLVGCGGSTGDFISSTISSVTAITESDVDNFLSVQPVSKAGSITLVDQDGTTGATYDIDKVYFTRVTATGTADTGLSYCFDMDLNGVTSIPSNSYGVLYIDTDNSNATGMSIAGIGADRRLVSNVSLGNAHFEWSNSTTSWVTLTGEVNAAYSAETSSVTGIVGKAQIYSVVLSSGTVLPNSTVQCVVALETVKNSNSETDTRYDNTSAFSVNGTAL